MARSGPREIVLHVESLGPDGLGAGRHGEREVRSRNALPGETVEMRVLKRRGGIWYGEAVTPEPGADSRRKPACENFPRCGGCALQHLDYAAQIAAKSARLEALLQEAGVVPGRVRRPVSGPRYHYRYKARLGVRKVGAELLVGFREGFSNRVARMSDCKTLAEPFARMLPELGATLARLDCSERIPQVELAGGDDAFAVIVRHLEALSSVDVEHLHSFARATGMRVYTQSGGYETVRPLDDGNGHPPLSYANADFGLHFEFEPTDFTQVNPVMNRALVRTAVAALGGAVEVVDLFCGIGNFSLALARAGVSVHGMENAAGAVERARHNARRNGVSGWAEFSVADLYDARSPDPPESDCLLLDPPRSGAGVNLERWVAPARLERIVYVSCNPQTFATDAARLSGRGFALAEVGVFDMFPHTAHVETLGVFVRS